MMNTGYPLPLELARPTPMAADLDTLLRTQLGGSSYDPTVQCGGGGDHGHGGSNSTCVNWGFLQVDDILNDFSL